MRGSTDGATPVTLASKQKQPESIAVDEQNVYWTNTGNKHPLYFTDGSVMRTLRGDVTFTAPVAYQERGGQKRPITVTYHRDGRQYGFAVGAYHEF